MFEFVDMAVLIDGLGDRMRDDILMDNLCLCSGLMDLCVGLMDLCIGKK